MIRYLAKRLGNYCVLLFVAVSLTFVLASTQLNPYSVYSLRTPPVPEDVIESTLRQYNLSNQVPLWERYGTWLSGIVTRWDWGYSPLGASVNDEVSVRIWVSLRLVLLGSIVGIALGIAVGAWTATRQYRFSDRAATAVSLLIVSTPVFVIGIVLSLAAIGINNLVGMNLFEITGETGTVGDYPGAEWVDRLQHLLLPTLVIAATGAATLSRIQRHLMLDALGTDYVRTARSKGVPYRTAVRRHALRTALIGSSTYIAFTVATMFVGAVFTERVFNFHGMGMYAMATIPEQNVYGIVAVTAFSGVCILAGALLADIFAAFLDPQIRLR